MIRKILHALALVTVTLAILTGIALAQGDLSLEGIAERLNITERLLVRHQVDIDDLTDRLTALETAAPATPAPTQVPTATPVPTAEAGAEPMEEAAYRVKIGQIFNSVGIGVTELMGTYETLIATWEQNPAARDGADFQQILEFVHRQLYEATETLGALTPPPHLADFHKLTAETLLACYMSVAEFSKNEPAADIKAKEYIALCTEKANAAGADPAWRDK